MSPVFSKRMRLVMEILCSTNDFPAGAVLMYGMGSTSAFK